MMGVRGFRFLPLAFLVLALAARVHDPAPVQQARDLVFDAYQRLSPRVYDPVSPVRVIDIDDQSLERIGQWPWPRTVLARLVDRLNRAGAAVVAFDMVLADADRTSPENALELWSGLPGTEALSDALARLPSHDAVLAESLARGQAVLGFVLTHGDAPPPPVSAGFVHAGDDPQRFVEPFSGAIANRPVLDGAARGHGALNWLPGRDQIVRGLPLFFRVGDQLYPSLAAEALRVATGAGSFVIKSSGASGEESFGRHTGVVSAKIGPFVARTGAGGQVLLYDSGPGAERRIPAWRVLDGSVPAEALAGRILFLGVSAAGLHDLRATPLSSAVPGVDIHAQIVEQIVGQTFLLRPDFADGLELVFLGLVGLGLILLVRGVGALWSGGVVVALLAAVGATSWLAFSQAGWLFDPLYPSLALIVIFAAEAAVDYLIAERERQQVRGAFGRYVSPTLVERLARDPAGLTLGGEMREMTLLFCDIRGFTGISEQLDAQSLTRFINRFLTPMSDVILSHRGTIDKFMGDAIMAFWNAPLDDPEHAARACRAALEMTARLEALNDAWRREAETAGRPFHRVAIGIGINTGRCCVGNMGSEQRFDYSVLGDAVNIASRLEGQTKELGAGIVIGESTAALVPGFALLELDRIAVKGKAEEIRVYALLGDETVAQSDVFRRLRSAHDALLRARRDGAPEAVTARIADCRAAAGPDLARLYDVYERRATVEV